MAEDVSRDDRCRGKDARDDDRGGDRFAAIVLTFARVVGAEDLGGGLEADEDVHEDAHEHDDLQRAVVRGQEQVCVEGQQQDRRDLAQDGPQAVHRGVLHELAQAPSQGLARRRFGHRSPSRLLPGDPAAHDRGRSTIRRRSQAAGAVHVMATGSVVGQRC